MRKIPLDAMQLASTGGFDEILTLDEAVTRLKEIAPTAAEVVRLRFYAGLSVEETALSLRLSERTVMREWAFARAWLHQALEEDRT